MSGITNVCVIFDQASWILLMVFILTISVHSGSARCLSHQYNLDGRRCCRRCAPGSGAATQCSYENDTNCQPCSHGQTYSGTHSHVDLCRPCTRLPESAQFIRKCNVTHDALWKCKDNFYRDDDRCILCKKCLPGWGASVPCSHRHNTICRKCPNGTFSDLLSGTSGCRVCTRCNDNQQMIQPCSSMLDTTCIDKPHVNYKTHNVLTRPLNDESRPPDGAHDPDWIILYCAVPGVIILALLVYVLIRRKRKTIGSRHIKDDPFRPPQGDIVYVDQDGNTVTLTTKLRDLPPHKQKEIEKTLQKKVAGRPSWIYLARELGYNKERISSMDAKAKHDHITTSKCLLQEWGKSQNATVGVLIKALKSIGRIDLVKILHGQPTTIVTGNTFVKTSTASEGFGPVCV